MKRFPYTRNGMKQVFSDCPHKGWAKKCVALVEGNVFDPAYRSAYIRPFSVVANGPVQRPEWVPGYLQTWDLDQIKAPESLRKYIRTEENREKHFIIMHVYGFGWIIYTSAREVLPNGQRVTKDTVSARFMESHRVKDIALMDWIVDAIQTEERYIIDAHGWPKYIEN